MPNKCFLVILWFCAEIVVCWLHSGYFNVLFTVVWQRSSGKWLQKQKVLVLVVKNARIWV